MKVVTVVTADEAQNNCETAAKHCLNVFEKHENNIQAQYRALALFENADRVLKAVQQLNN